MTPARVTKSQNSRGLSLLHEIIIPKYAQKEKEKEFFSKEYLKSMHKHVILVVQ